MTGLAIVYRDERLIAIDKPAGLLVHRSDLDRRETRFAVQLLREQTGRVVWPVHRLDKGTSGLLLFALDAESASLLGRQFEAGEVAKRYLAVVRGWPDEAGEIDHPLGRMADEYGYRSESDIPQPAVTRYRRLATAELPHGVDRYPTSRYALVELAPQNGRRHQLRWHMKHIAHPIIGDATHGKSRHNRLFQELFGCQRLLLASTQLRFRHPDDGREVVLCAPPAPDFADVARRLGWTEHVKGIAMALKATIYKADLSIADMDRNYYADHSLTLARHPSETDERMMVRLLAFVLYAREGLGFGKGLCVDDEPDLWQKDLTGAIQLWIDVGHPDEKWLRKACNRSEQVVLVNYGGRSSEIWWDQNKNALTRLDKLSIINLPTEAVDELRALANRTMRLQCTVQDGQVMITDGERTAHIEPARR